MKKVILLITLLFTVLFGVKAQDAMQTVDDVIHWNFSVEYAECDEARIIITVKQDDGWHIYSQVQPEGGISQPTVFEFVDNDSYTLVGKTKEYGAKLHGGAYPERIFDGKKAVFKQKIKIKSKKDFKIKLKYDFMACLESCFPPENRETTIKVKGANCDGTSVEIVNNEEVVGAVVEVDTLTMQANSEIVESLIGFKTFAIKRSNTEYDLVITPEIGEGWQLKTEGDNPLSLKFNGDLKTEGSLILANSKDGFYVDSSFVQRIIIAEKDSTMKIDGTLLFSGLDDEGKAFESKPLKFEIDLVDAATQKITDETENSSYWGIFWLAFAGGLVALLTPCVFPMIPMTVSFFTKGSENKKKGLFKGVMYGFFILLIYVLLSVPFHLLDELDPSILNNIATFGPLNIFFFLMLFIFALSFLGAFEIVLPAKWTNKADSKSDLGGLIGVFFMALTLALVSFSCTGPILGSLLANASSAGGGAWNLTWGMAGFGLALGLPFALFAIFPSWLNGLPSSGGWLNNVKVFLGFLELAFAFKFLSNADISWNAHLLERELFIAIWVGIFGALTMYLFGLFQTKHDSPITGGLGTFRVVLGTFVFIFTMYLVPGMFGAPVKIISAFPPPMSYSEIPYGIHGHAPEFEGKLPDGAKFEHGLMVFDEVDKAQAYAKKENKPLMLDFTGEQCVNCRKMEATVWSVEKVHKLMNEDFVIVSLYVDDKDLLPSKEVSPYSGRELVSWGDKWSDMQTVLYKKNTQPQYITLDKNGEIMNTDATFKSHGEGEIFEKWLKDAKEEYKKRTGYKTYFGEILYVTK